MDQYRRKSGRSQTSGKDPASRRGRVALIIGLLVLISALGLVVVRGSSDAPAEARRSSPAREADRTASGWAARAEVPWEREWASYSCEDPSRVTRVRSPKLSGLWSYRLQLRDGDTSFGERCELGQGNPTRSGFPLFTEGQERWISFAVFLPSAYPMPVKQWNVFAQVKGLGPGGPPLALEARQGRFALANATDAVQANDISRFLWTGPARRHRWTRFTLHVKFSPDRAVGFVELFGGPAPGTQRRLMRRVRTHTMKRDATGKAIPSHSRIGPYRDPGVPGTANLYFDDYVVSSSPPPGIEP